MVDGGACSNWWPQLLSNVLAVPLTLAEGGEEGDVLGAARQAWLADGGVGDAVCREPPAQARFEPDAAVEDAHRQRHQCFKALYGALAPHF